MTLMMILKILVSLCWGVNKQNVRQRVKQKVGLSLFFKHRYTNTNTNTNTHHTPSLSNPITTPCIHPHPIQHTNSSPSPLPPSHTHLTMQVSKEGKKVLEMSIVVCSADVNSPQLTKASMICDVHFGDTRNDLTPAIGKWLPNNHTEERTTTRICDEDDNNAALHSPNTRNFHPSQRLTLWNSGKMRRGR